MNTIIILTGKSASGKTTLANIISENYRYDKIITYTTRPKRQNEKDGVDYYFISDEEFKQSLEKGEFIEFQEYKTSNGLWRYGTKFSEIEKHDDSIIILETFGLLNFKKRYNNTISFYIDCPDKERWIRQIKRGDDIIEIALRDVRERTIFSNINSNVDYIIPGLQSPQMAIHEILTLIEKHSKR